MPNFIKKSLTVSNGNEVAINLTAIMFLLWQRKLNTLFNGYYVLDVLWCQPIKLIQVVSTSEFHEY
jgi:hypothetical protein